MFKKLVPLIVILALIAAYASYRVVAAQSSPAGISTYSSWTSRYTRAAEYGKAYVPNTGGMDELKSDTSPSSGISNYWQRRQAARFAGQIKTYTNLSTTDGNRAKTYVVTDYTNRWRR